ncbi:MAG: flagellar hook assembly protein FlgD [Lentisphaerae bacterium]|nr:MAG: flagellar hook assembly protein FlgD [Lentisphaerota bacterium]
MQITAASSTPASLEVNNTTVTEPSEMFDKLGYLKLLIAQLQNQDPLNPMDNNEFMNQMTQFSMLEQLQNMTSAFTDSTKTNMITSAANLVGKQVSLRPQPDTTVEGVVEKIRYVDEHIELLVDGNWYNIEHLASVATVSNN